MSISAGLKKLTIKAFEDAEQDKETGAFEAFYNPSSFQASFALKYDEEAAKGSSKREMRYKGYDPATFQFELLIDGTGASIPASATEPNKSVKERIQDFMTVVYNFNSESHRSNYLILTWGDHFAYKCVLTSVSITYDLFKPDGDPLRAKLGCQFKEYSYIDLTKAEEGKNSPDMTHIRVVQQGDRLPTMCERIYGDSKLYLQVARANGLLDFRNLVPGQKLYFPPLQKN